MSNFKNLKTGRKINVLPNGERPDNGEFRKNDLLNGKIYGGSGNEPGARIGVDEIAPNGLRPDNK